MTDAPLAPSAPPQIATVTLPELWAAVKDGVWDFRRAPQFGIAFSAFYVFAGISLSWIGAGTFLWTLAFALGFPFVAPFAAVGLYEVSRRIEADEPLVWREVLGVIWNERRRQLPWMGAILAIVFLFWSFFAHMTFALFMGLGALDGGAGWGAYMTPNGLMMLGVALELKIEDAVPERDDEIVILHDAKRADAAGSAVRRRRGHGVSRLRRHRRLAAASGRPRD